VAVQRFGDGRAMLFAGEAAWRWRMLRPASDRDYETFWRQAVRWLAVPASDPVAVSIPPGAAPADKVPVRLVVRNAAFQPQPDAVVDVRVTTPSGRLEALRAAPDADAAGPGRFVAQVTPDERGVYRVTADARRGTTALGTASTSLLVGGADVEMTDPRRNDELLRRVALASGGRLLSEDQLSTLPALLEASATRRAGCASRSLAHEVVVCRRCGAAGYRVELAPAMGAQVSARTARNLTCGAILLVQLLAATPAAAERYALIVAGASGGPEYAQQYAAWTKDLVAVLVDRMKVDKRHITVLSDAAAGTSSLLTTSGDRSPRCRAMTRRSSPVVLIGHMCDGIDASSTLLAPNRGRAVADLIAGFPATWCGQHSSASFPLSARPASGASSSRQPTRRPTLRYRVPRLLHQGAAGDTADIDKNGRISRRPCRGDQRCSPSLQQLGRLNRACAARR
jgi:hypothetical protein